jgi:hypothetical protein
MVVKSDALYYIITIEANQNNKVSNSCGIIQLNFHSITFQLSQG